MTHRYLVGNDSQFRFAYYQMKYVNNKQSWLYKLLGNWYLDHSELNGSISQLAIYMFKIMKRRFYVEFGFKTERCFWFHLQFNDYLKFHFNITFFGFFFELYY